MDIRGLSKANGELLKARSLTLAVAESCTGGLLGAYITDSPGSSAYFEGGIIAYAYSVKENLLCVPANILQRYGAVSSQTAVAMALEVRRLLKVNVALSVTGIAGPGGATPEKPVGLVYVALAAQGIEDWRKFVFSGDRQGNRELAAKAALELLHEYLRRCDSVSAVGPAVPE